MKKLFGIGTIGAIAALLLAFSPLAQAQGVNGHPDARNDRRMERPHVVVRHVPPPKVHRRHHRRHHPVHR